MNICCHCHIILAGIYVSHNIISLECKCMSQIMARTNRERKFQGANVPGGEYSWVRMFPCHYESFLELGKERKSQGMNWPGSKKAMERIGRGPIG